MYSFLVLQIAAIKKQVCLKPPTANDGITKKCSGEILNVITTDRVVHANCKKQIKKGYVYPGEKHFREWDMYICK